MKNSSVKQKSRKITGKILKTLWIIIGVLVLIWNIYWFVRVKIMYDYAFIINVIMFAMGIYSFFIYIGITIFFVLIKWLIKKFLKKRKKKKHA